MTNLQEKFQEVISSVVPVTLLVLLIQILFRPLSGAETGKFIFSSLVLIVGLALFLLGIDISITPMGQALGKGLVHSNKALALVIGSFFLGFIISVAEPDLLILAGSVDAVTGGFLRALVLVVVVSLGLGLMVALSFLRVIRLWPLARLFRLIYLGIGLLAVLCPSIYLAIAFDASGATTGSITVPFVLALSIGVAQIVSSQNLDGSENYGTVGMASAGAILAVLAYGIVAPSPEHLTAQEAVAADSQAIFAPFFQALPGTIGEGIMSLLPLVLIFFGYNAWKKELRGEQLRRVCVGLFFALLGLILFLTAANSGFMSTGRAIGSFMATKGNLWLSATGFLLGLTTILAEPAVHVLTKSIEEQSAGHLPRSLIYLFLCVGVAFSVLLAMVRMYVPGLELWHLLLPGYALALILTYFTPDLFVGIAFDSGGVASGPMTATFILAFAEGAATSHPLADVLVEGFGVIALVAMAPVVMLQILGIIYQAKMKKLKENAEEPPAGLDSPVARSPQERT